MEILEDVKTSSKVNLDEIDSSMVDEKIEINTDVNPMEAPPPVADGIHRVKLAIDMDKGWNRAFTKPKSGEPRSYLSCNFYGVVQAEGTPENNKRVFEWISNLVFNGKSRMGYVLLQVMGGKDNPQAVAAIKGLDNPVDLAKGFQQVLAGEPIVRVETEWQARYNAGSKEAPNYKTAKTGMKNFPLVDPKDPSKGYRHIINVPGFGDVSAQAVVKDYFPDNS